MPRSLPARLSRTRHMLFGLYFAMRGNCSVIYRIIFPCQAEKITRRAFYMRLHCERILSDNLFILRRWVLEKFLNSRRKNLPGVLCSFGRRNPYGRIFIDCAQMGAGGVFKFQAEKFTRQALF